MSLIIQSNNIECWVRSKPNGMGVFDNKIMIGDYDIPIDDFCEIVRYVLTNTDLDTGLGEAKPRLKLLKDSQLGKVVSGYNPKHIRIEIPRLFLNYSL